ncbi:MAG: hypothetical protein DRN12_07325 [Thermoplasmata archaeon]|nr:MAG: hypothetical protein DRN12_07325 [Thermoplasmata archaeon]
MDEILSVKDYKSNSISGIEIEYSLSNLISNYSIKNNYKGIQLVRYCQNTISRCIISNNRFCGIYNYDSENNSITYNDFINNLAHYIGWQGDKNSS